MGDAGELRVLLEKLGPHVRARKPKLCKEVMGEIRKTEWPGEYGSQLTELAKWIGKYKFKEARKILDAMMEKTD